MRLLFSFGAGALFGLGLLVSGMTDTTKVQGWLDLFGAWDPTLAFVFAGALAPMFIAWRIARARDGAVLGGSIPIPTNIELDRRLILGSTLFGAGWGLSGFCPGPAMASLSFGGTSGIIFLIAMILGMIGARALRMPKPA
jgi:uncharacterized membrane protein YedE/YeeE